MIILKWVRKKEQNSEHKYWSLIEKGARGKIKKEYADITFDGPNGFYLIMDISKTHMYTDDTMKSLDEVKTKAEEKLNKYFEKLYQDKFIIEREK